jgi:hypothetical protein
MEGTTKKKPWPPAQQSADLLRVGDGRIMRHRTPLPLPRGLNLSWRSGQVSVVGAAEIQESLEQVAATGVLDGAAQAVIQEAADTLASAGQAAIAAAGAVQEAQESLWLFLLPARQP